MKPRKAVTRKEFEKWAAADVTDQTPKDGWAPYPKPSGWTPPTEEQKAERRKAATHFRRLTLFQLSKPGEDLYPQAWWFNEGSGIWQWHDLTNDEVRRFQPVNASEETPKTKQCPKCSREMVRHNAEYNCLCGYGEIIPENAGAMVRGLAAPDADNTTEIDG